MTDATTPAEDAPLYVLDIHASKFMLIEVFDAHVDPVAGLTIMAGSNANGKTGAMTALEATLRGGSSIPEMPVKAGEERAETGFVVGGADGKPKYTARRVYRDGSDKSTLTVTAADGSKVSSPQSFLDSLTDSATFNPVKFADPKMRTVAADNAARLEMLFELCPLRIDLAKHDAEHLKLFNERTEVRKRAKALEAVVVDAAKTTIVDSPEEDESPYVTGIAKAENAEELRSRAKKRVDELAKEIDDVDAEVKRLQEKARLLGEEWARQGNLASNKEATDVAPLKSKLAEIRERNVVRRAGVADRAKAEERAKTLLAEKTRDDELTKKLDAMDKERVDAISAAKFPVKALTIDSEGRLAISKDGKVVPFSQASKAQRVKVGFAVMASKNPKLRACLIPDANDLDAESMRDLALIAKRYGMRVFAERWLPDKSGTSIIFEDGRKVREEPAGGAS